MTVILRQAGHRSVDLASLTRFAFLTLPNYSMIACSNALEACRMANYVSGQPAYAWHVATLDGLPVAASNGLSLHPTEALAEIGDIDILLVCGGIDIRHAIDRRLKDTLRRMARRGVTLGALCTGTFALAEAGLLDGYRCAIHWENLGAIREEFADVAFAEDLFVIDGDRITCTGGVAPLEMMLTLIAAHLGRDLAAKVTEQFIVERVRPASDRQVAHLPFTRGVPHPAVEKAARLMAEHIAIPLTTPAIATAVGLSTRQLERLFRQFLGRTPAEFYLALRLDRARELLRLTSLPVTEIGIASGFQSASHFSTSYRSQFGHTPSGERAARRVGDR